MQKIRSYTELMSLPDFASRFEYVKLGSAVSEETFGRHARYLNQKLYQSSEWRDFRRRIIARDAGDLGDSDRPLTRRATVHHLNPITEEQILANDPALFDPENVIAVNDITHKAIHYSDIELLPSGPTIRTPGDTCPWKGA